MKTLSELGPRIAIIGPSNAGKSTFAAKLGEKVGFPVCHLDQIAHEPYTAWKRRDNQAFKLDHDKLIQNESWVMEGNYSFLMPERFERASAIIWLDPHRLGCLARLIMRAIQDDKGRVGRLEGATQEFSWGLIHFTLCDYPKNKRKYERLLMPYQDKLLRVPSMRELNKLYAFWGLSKPKE